MKKKLKYISMCFVVFVGSWPQSAVAITTVPVLTNPTCKQINLTIKQSKYYAKQYARSKIKQVGWDHKEYRSLLILWSKESKWDYTANNPKSTAFGIPQMLNMPEDTPLEKQIDLGMKYIKKRYKTPTLALQHHSRKGWY